MEAKTKVLVVDDSELTLEVTRTCLEGAGFEVHTQSTAVGTGAMLLKVRPDILLLDLGLPNVGGIQLLDMIRDSDASPQLRVILHSSMRKEQLREVAREAGADGYVCKRDGTRSLLAEITRCREMVGHA